MKNPKSATDEKCYYFDNVSILLLFPFGFLDNNFYSLNDEIVISSTKMYFLNIFVILLPAIVDVLSSTCSSKSTCDLCIQDSNCDWCFKPVS